MYQLAVISGKSGLTVANITTISIKTNPSVETWSGYFETFVDIHLAKLSRIS
jgi:hypothetical protein